MSEKQIAMMGAEIINASDKYFNARPQVDTDHNRHIFEAGFERGYKVERLSVRLTQEAEQLKEKLRLSANENISLDADNEQLRQELANIGSSKELLELDLKEMRQERDETASHVERLLSINDAAKHYLTDTSHGVERTASAERQLIHELESAFFKSSSTSLQQHDNEVIERCVDTCRNHYAIEADNDTVDACIRAILALKTGEGNEQ